MSKPFVGLCTSVLLLVAAACIESDAPPERAPEGASAKVTVDSALSTAERLARFRATVADHPDTLRRASRSLEDLANRWATAVEKRDTAALNAMVMDRAEFAWLFYPTTRLAHPPYEMPPALLWEQVLANSDDGAKKLLDRFGGRALVVRSVRCPAPADTEGTNLVRQGCLVRLRSAADTIPEDRFFGTVIERDGRWKLLGYSNKL